MLNLKQGRLQIYMNSNTKYINSGEIVKYLLTETPLVTNRISKSKSPT